MKFLPDFHQLTQPFEVKEYVPPKYAVNLETPDFLLLNDEEIKGRVCARYTYGKRVRGRASVKIQRKRYRRNEGEPSLVSCNRPFLNR